VYVPLCDVAKIDVEKNTRNLFIRACVSWKTADWGKLDDYPSERQRKISRLAKSLLKTAEKIRPHTLANLIPPGVERRTFLKDRTFHPRTLFEFEDDIGQYGFEDYRGNYGGDDFHFPNQIPVHGLIFSLAKKLEAQAQTIDGSPQTRTTKIATYIMALRHHCKAAFGTIPNPLVLDIARVVSGQRDLSVDNVRTR
jgi:hypothetical protein